MVKKEKKQDIVASEDVNEGKKEIPEKEKINYSKQGKKNRAAGRLFEAKVRASLENLGWVVDKWTNTVDYEKWKLVPAKRKYNPFLKVLIIGTGFPDFICFKRIDEESEKYNIIGVEVKKNGYLDQIEKGMCHWLLENRIFSKILIAKLKKEEGKKMEVEYIDFNDKYKKEFKDKSE
jgi:hypothetical protein